LKNANGICLIGDTEIKGILEPSEAKMHEMHVIFRTAGLIDINQWIVTINNAGEEKSFTQIPQHTNCVLVK
jgi:hypothetical protein